MKETSPENGVAWNLTSWKITYIFISMKKRSIKKKGGQGSKHVFQQSQKVTMPFMENSVIMKHN